MIITSEKIQPVCDELKFLMTSPFNPATDFIDLNCHFETHPLDDLISWGLSTFGDKIAPVTSFGPTSMVILDYLAKLSPGIRVITIDPGFLFEETYALWEQVQRRYPIHLEIYKSLLTPEQQARLYHPTLWQTDPDQCCYLRKVLPLSQALAGLDAWITGLRRDQSPARARISLIAWDARYHRVKLNPLANWTRSQVWRYIVEHDVPYNPLHNQGYASIGCTHCTRPTTNSADERSGRWQGYAKTECGIHV